MLDRLRPFIVSLVTAAAGVAAFRAFLPERSDYVGHFIAGNGATLGHLAFALHVATGDDDADDADARRATERMVVWLVVVSIGLGAVCEATVFRIAQFDPVDFYNQSLGAVLAGLAVLASRPSRATLGSCLVGFGIVAVVSVYEGFHRAFA